MHRKATRVNNCRTQNLRFDRTQHFDLTSVHALRHCTEQPILNCRRSPIALHWRLKSRCRPSPACSPNKTANIDLRLHALPEMAYFIHPSLTCRQQLNVGTGANHLAHQVSGTPRDVGWMSAETSPSAPPTGWHCKTYAEIHTNCVADFTLPGAHNCHDS